MTIRENAKRATEMLEKVKSHCMCARFEDLGGAYRVLYADGFFPNGVQAAYAQCGKAVALERMLNVMERHWLESYP